MTPNCYKDPCCLPDAFQCAAHEAYEETGGALSDVSRARIACGAGLKGRVAVFCGPYQTAATQSVAVAHDLVHEADMDVPKRFNKEEAARLAAASEKTAIRTTIKKKKPRKRVPTVTLSTEFVPLASLRDAAWRQEHMHLWPHAKLVAEPLARRVLTAQSCASKGRTPGSR